MKTKMLLILVFTSLFACDKIDNPVLLIPGENGGLTFINWELYPDGGPDDYPFPVFTSSNNIQRFVLLEDYTGHKCTNCPAANAIAEGIVSNNNGKVILASIHASTSGGFQQVDAEHPVDFTTPAGDAYADEMPDFFGNPAGTINRISGGLNGSVWYLSADWNSKVSELLASPNTVNIQISHNFFSETNALFIHAHVEFLTPLQGNYNLAFYLVRELVIAPQSLNNGTINHEYEHHNVLSDNLNGNWGTPIALDTGAVNPNYSIEYHQSYVLPDAFADSTYDIENLSIIAYLMNRDSFEILQVVESSVTP